MSRCIVTATPIAFGGHPKPIAIQQSFRWGFLGSLEAAKKDIQVHRPMGFLGRRDWRHAPRMRGTPVSSPPRSRPRSAFVI